jgi:small subunit ribosomal protein S18
MEAFMAVPVAKKKRRFSRPKRTLDPRISFDYKDTALLRRFVTEHGRIVPRRISGASTQQQRELTIAVKRARLCALLPYVPGAEAR